MRWIAPRSTVNFPTSPSTTSSLGRRRRIGTRFCRAHREHDAFPRQFNEELAMQGSTKDRTSTDFVVIHPLDPEDGAITAAMRAMVSSSKGARPGIEARGQFDALMESVLP